MIDVIAYAVLIIGGVLALLLAVYTSITEHRLPQKNMESVKGVWNRINSSYNSTGKRIIVLTVLSGVLTIAGMIMSIIVNEQEKLQIESRAKDQAKNDSILIKNQEIQIKELEETRSDQETQYQNLAIAVVKVKANTEEVINYVNPENRVELIRLKSDLKELDKAYSDALRALEIDIKFFIRSLNVDSEMSEVVEHFYREGSDWNVGQDLSIKKIEVLSSLSPNSSVVAMMSEISNSLNEINELFLRASDDRKDARRVIGLINEELERIFIPTYIKMQLLPNYLDFEAKHLTINPRSLSESELEELFDLPFSERGKWIRSKFG